MSNIAFAMRTKAKLAAKSILIAYI
jgi:hypothetical protein